MAARGTVKHLSVQQENHIAKLFHGQRSKSSGASDTDKGDVTSEEYKLKIECKMTQVRAPKKIIDEFEKITGEAYADGKMPGLALRSWDIHSPLADQNGWIDLFVMLASDAAELFENAQI